MDRDDEPRQPYQDPISQLQESTPEQAESRQEKDLSQYSLSVETASDLFNRADVPRSIRSVIRYCSNNTLDCIKVDTERNMKYLVSLKSVQARIVELQQIMAFRHDAPRHDMTRHDETINESRHDTARHDAPRDENTEHLKSRVGDLERENEELRNKNRDLEITNRVKDSVLKKNEGMLATAHTQLMRFNRVVGELATVLRLKAPDQDTTQIIAFLDAPTQATDLEHENFVDAPS